LTKRSGHLQAGPDDDVLPVRREVLHESAGAPKKLTEMRSNRSASPNTRRSRPCPATFALPDASPKGSTARTLPESRHISRDRALAKRPAWTLTLASVTGDDASPAAITSPSPEISTPAPVSAK